MVNHTSIIVLGFLVFIMPYLGFPHSWHPYIYMILGALIMLFGYRVLHMHTGVETSGMGETFVEAAPVKEKEPQQEEQHHQHEHSRSHTKKQ